MKDYTVFIVSFAYFSFFLAHIKADSVEDAMAKGVDRADAETGVPEYECLACFDGAITQPESPYKIYDWR